MADLNGTESAELPRTSRPARIVAALSGAIVLCAVSGCYERLTEGQAAIYRFAWWVPPSVFAGSLIGIPAGWLLSKWATRCGYALMLTAAVVLVFVTPSTLLDSVRVDDDHFEARYGFWFQPTIHNIQFSDLSAIQYVAVPGRRGQTNYELQCLTNAGRMEVVHAGDLVKHTITEILARAKAKGVPVLNQVP